LKRGSRKNSRVEPGDETQIEVKVEKTKEEKKKENIPEGKKEVPSPEKVNEQISRK
jgi:hypothetical protein